MLDISLVQFALPMSKFWNSFFPQNPSLADELSRLFADLNIEDESPPNPTIEQIWEEFRSNGRDYEYCPEIDSDCNGATPSKFAPRRKKHKKPLPRECVFCRNNGEEEVFYKQHILRDAEGRIICPVLRAYTCPICGARGDDAHTMKYCPQGRSKSSPFVSTVNSLKNSSVKAQVYAD